LQLLFSINLFYRFYLFATSTLSEQSAPQKPDFPVFTAGITFVSLSQLVPYQGFSHTLGLRDIIPEGE